MEQQGNQGNLETRCRFCGNESPDGEREERPDHYQVLVACSMCGNDFAALSRN